MEKRVQRPPRHVHYQVIQAMLFFLRMNVSAGQMISVPIQDSANDLVQEKDADISVVHVCLPCKLG